MPFGGWLPIFLVDNLGGFSMSRYLSSDELPAPLRPSVEAVSDLLLALARLRRTAAYLKVRITAAAQAGAFDRELEALWVGADLAARHIVTALEDAGRARAAADARQDAPG